MPICMIQSTYRLYFDIREEKTNICFFLFGTKFLLWQSLRIQQNQQKIKEDTVIRFFVISQLQNHLERFKIHFRQHDFTAKRKVPQSYDELMKARSIENSTARCSLKEEKQSTPSPINKFW